MDLQCHKPFSERATNPVALEETNQKHILACAAYDPVQDKRDIKRAYSQIIRWVHFPHSTSKTLASRLRSASLIHSVLRYWQILSSFNPSLLASSTAWR